MEKETRVEKVKRLITNASGGKWWLYSYFTKALEEIRMAGNNPPKLKSPENRKVKDGIL